MSTGHAISGTGLLISLGVHTIVAKYPSNQIINTNNSFILEVIVLAYIKMSIDLVGFPQWSSNCDLNGWK